MARASIAEAAGKVPTNVDGKVSALERAFQLARSGRIGTVDDIKKQLKQEGYDVEPSPVGRPRQEQAPQRAVEPFGERLTSPPIAALVRPHVGTPGVGLFPPLAQALRPRTPRPLLPPPFFSRRPMSHGMLSGKSGYAK
jgi:hypothetical protein